MCSGHELRQVDPLGAISDLSHRTLLHTCSETEVPANRSHRAQLPVTLLGVCRGAGTEPIMLDYCHPGISHNIRKIPSSPRPLVSRLQKPKAYPW